jgi:antitoxin (DNA-binding transcriptional repressor) of toxin-antitoxin stability system
MTQNMVMKQVKNSDANIGEIKAHFSEYLSRVEAGEAVRIFRRREPVAELRRIEKPWKGKRPCGLARGLFQVPQSFFDPLPEDVLAAFEGQ